MTDKEVMQMALDTFNKSKRSHYYCEDIFYSCPKHKEGCADDFAGDECNCGADTVNKSIDAAIEALRIAIEQAEKQEPFEYWNAVEGWVAVDKEEVIDGQVLQKMRQEAYKQTNAQYRDDPEVMFAIGFESGFSSRLKEKNT